MPINILHIAPDFDYCNGVRKYISSLLNLFNDDEEYNLHLITNKGTALETLEKLNVKVQLLQFEKGFKNIYHLRNNLKNLSNYCKANKIDIIHSHHRYPEYLSNRLSKKLNIKTITTAHSFVNNFKKISFKSDKIIAVSNAVKEHIKKDFNIDEKKIQVLYNFPFIENDTEVDISKLKNLLSIPEENKVLLLIGRISKVKGADLLLNVFNKLKEKYNNITLLLVGNMDNKITSLYHSNKTNIVFINEQSDVSKFYKISDIVALPSINDPFPYTMIEAGYFKKVFLGADSGGIGEYITHNENGLLFKTSDEEDLYSKLKILIDKNELNIKLASNLHSKVTDQLCPEKYFHQLSSIYRDLIDAK